MSFMIIYNMQYGQTCIGVTAARNQTAIATCIASRAT
jgi:hypothetical protein